MKSCNVCRCELLPSGCASAASTGMTSAAVASTNAARIANPPFIFHSVLYAVCVGASRQSVGGELVAAADIEHAVRDRRRCIHAVRRRRLPEELAVAGVVG